MSHHHTYYVYALKDIYLKPQAHHTYYVTSSYILCHIIIHTMCMPLKTSISSHKPIIHTMSHHHTYYVYALKEIYLKPQALWLTCVTARTHTNTNTIGE